ncbi:MAG: hypothetical protein EXS08_11995 [Planctomycetes bacterium]|nr:hypothetical protein [Planctomycetota bacterium]
MGVRFELDGSVHFWITPERRVLYLADAESDEVVELYDAPIDGSQAAVKRNETLPQGGDVIAVESAGRSVVYLADQDSDELFELYFDRDLDTTGPHTTPGAAIGRTVTRQL